MNKAIYQLLAVIFIVSMLASCEVEDIDTGPFNITVKNETCTSWTIKENGKTLVTIGKNASSGGVRTASFTAEKGKHTCVFSPDPDTCFFSGFILGYVYEQADATFSVEKDMTINIGTLAITAY
jgi:hypothetical protein